MKKSVMKLAIACVSLLLAVSMTAVASFAWMTLSDSPAVEGLYIAISGGNTILLAPNVVVEEDGQTYCYPGEFDDTLIFQEHEAYAYLQNMAGLTPVSTADGENWYLPTYYQPEDQLVRDGLARSGDQKPFSQFYHDTVLEYANLDPAEAEKIQLGSYLYLDFWVVSPGAEYQLRLSRGEDSASSFVIDLPTTGEVDTDGDGKMDTYRLEANTASGAAALRVGFLVNEARVSDQSMLYYMISGDYNEYYRSLQGVYLPDGSYAEEMGNRFTIYEPNGNLHTIDSGAENGNYYVTNPLGKTQSGVLPVDVSDKLSVQLENRWRATEQNQILVEQIFQTSIAGKSLGEQSQEEVFHSFYYEYLQEQIAPYVQAGSFVTSTQELYEAVTAGRVTAEELEQRQLLSEGNFLSGATEDTYIVQLQRNVPQRIRMFIWLEGQDMDCVNAIQTGHFAINLELAGSSLSDDET